MTRFDTDLASRGWALIAEGATMISLAYAAAEASSIEPAAVAVPAAGVVSPPAPALADLPDLPPILDEYGNEVLPATPAPAALKPQVDAGLGVCPIHGVHWTVKPAGVGAKGAYDAFYRCAEKEGEGWCKQKPQKIWRDTHPIREVAA